MEEKKRHITVTESEYQLILTALSARTNDYRDRIIKANDRDHRNLLREIMNSYSALHRKLK